MSLDAWLLSQPEVSWAVPAMEKSFFSTSCGLVSSRISKKRKEINSVSTFEVLQRDDIISKRRKFEERGNL